MTMYSNASAYITVGYPPPTHGFVVLLLHQHDEVCILQAIKDCSSAQDALPSKVPLAAATAAHLRRGRLLELLERFAESAVDYKAALELDPSCKQVSHAPLRGSHAAQAHAAWKRPATRSCICVYCQSKRHLLCGLQASAALARVARFIHQDGRGSNSSFGQQGSGGSSISPVVRASPLVYRMPMLTA